MHSINAASAAAPGISFMRAVEALAYGASDPVLGPISVAQVQLCPQHAGALCEDLVDRLMDAHPATRFRIHATPRVAGNHGHAIVEAVDAMRHLEQMKATADLSRRMRAPAYTLHAGRAETGSLEEALEATKRLADIFGCRVGIEGMYPSTGGRNKWLLATWAEHETLLASGCDFAIDLSHAHIVAKREGALRMDLMTDLVASERCLEVHLSDNSGRIDSHRPLDPASPPWWLPLLERAHPDAVMFYEGVVIDPRKRERTLSKAPSSS